MSGTPIFRNGILKPEVGNSNNRTQPYTHMPSLTVIKCQLKGWSIDSKK